MTVHELIEQLEALPPQLEVFTTCIMTGQHGSRKVIAAEVETLVLHGYPSKFYPHAVWHARHFPADVGTKAVVIF